MSKKIVVVGAGYAGILVTKKLSKMFKKQNNVEITIIDRNPFHTMLTELHEVAAGRVDEDSIKISLKKVFAGRRVKVVRDTVKSVDYDNKSVYGIDGNYGYDYFVLATGSKPTYFGIPGVEEFAWKLWSYEDAVVLKERILDAFRKAAIETKIEEKKRLLSFHIVGAGFTGVEMAGELAEYVPFLCRKFEIDRELVTIVNIDILKRSVPILPEKLSVKAEKRLKKMGVTMMLNTGVVAIGSDFIETKTGDAVKHFPAGTVIWAAGTEGSDIANEAAGILKSEKKGRIKVDSFLRSVSDDSVYVIGDNMFFIPEGTGEPVPQMVENCEHSAGIAAANIYCAVTGKGAMEEYKPAFHGMMVSIGGRYAVAWGGLPNHFFSLPSLFAMLAKHFINILYFINVLGWNKVYSYIWHEFFTIRNSRSILGGHFSNRTPSFLLVAIRLWLGAVFVFEGVMKIVEGWFGSPKLAGFFGGANSWYNSILNIKDATGSATTAAAAGAADAVSSATTAAAGAVTSAAGAVTSAAGAADAVSSATTAAAGAVSSAAGAVSSAAGAADAVSSATTTAAAGVAGAVQSAVHAVGTAILNFNFLNLFHIIFVSGKSLAQSTLSDYAFKIDIPLMNLFINKVILAHDSIQIIMQVFIVIAEILVGLALIGGLLTTPASAFSLVLQAMFVTTTGLYLNTFWMIFAAVALLIGAGRTLGLDYYFMPYLKKQWKKIPIVRKLYIYND